MEIQAKATSNNAEPRLTMPATGVTPIFSSPISIARMCSMSITMMDMNCCCR